MMAHLRVQTAVAVLVTGLWLSGTVAAQTVPEPVPAGEVVSSTRSLENVPSSARVAMPSVPQPLDVMDVVAMTAAGVEQELIVRQIRDNGMNRALTTNDLISLKQRGVSTEVMRAMQAASPPVAATVAPRSPVVVDSSPVVVYRSAPPPVVVRTYPPPVVIAPPLVYPYHFYHHGPPHHGPSPRVSFGVTFR